jgi:hypothetical protein
MVRSPEYQGYVSLVPCLLSLFLSNPFVVGKRQVFKIAVGSLRLALCKEKGHVRTPTKASFILRTPFACDIVA